ncbi:MAG: Flp pilus assembly protein CpaB [Collinsella sp.]|nr:Flp pilus assembly protein CpaB [Collinsella sp.]
MTRDDLAREMNEAASRGDFERARALKEELERVENGVPDATRESHSSLFDRIRNKEQEGGEPSRGVVSTAATPEAARARAASMSSASRERSSRTLILVAAASIALGIAAVAFTGARLVTTQAEISKIESQTSDYLTVTSELAAGSVITEGDLKVEKMPRAYVPSDAAGKGDAEDIVGKTTTAKQTPGAPISLSTISASSAPGSLPTAIAEGHLGLMVALDTASGASPLIAVGDQVTVLGAVSGSQEVTALCSNVRVLAIDGNLSGNSETGYATVTLELTPEQAEAVAGAERIHLASQPRVIGGGDAQ